MKDSPHNSPPNSALRGFFETRIFSISFFPKARTLFFFSAFVGKVQNKLPEESKMKQVQYLIAIDQVLKNTKNTTLPVGSALMRIPYEKTPDCPCPLLPKVTFIFMGQVSILPTQQRSEMINVTQPALVQKWNKDFLNKLKTKCSKYLDFKEMN